MSIIKAWNIIGGGHGGRNACGLNMTFSVQKPARDIAETIPHDDNYSFFSKLSTVQSEMKV